VARGTRLTIEAFSSERQKQHTKTLPRCRRRVAPNAAKAARRKKAKREQKQQQAVQAVITETFPDHLFLGEELPGDAAEIAAGLSGDQYIWIVDPLDGTTNYVHRLQTYSVSIALMHLGIPVAGVVYDPVLGDCYRAVRGGGAWLNRQPISTSGCTSLEQSLLAASFSANVARNSLEVLRFVEILHRCRALRRLGSAALNLSYVAAGRLDGYWATSVSIWDVAAGLLLVQEAGGCIGSLTEGEVDWAKPQFVATASGPLQQALTKSLQEAVVG